MKNSRLDVNPENSALSLMSKLTVFNVSYFFYTLQG